MEVKEADRVLDSDEEKALDSRTERLATFMQKDISQEQKRLVVSEFRKYKRQFEIYRKDSLDFNLSESLEYGNAIDALVKRSTFGKIIPDTRIILDGRSISVSILDPTGDTFELSVHNPDKYYEPEIYRVLKSTFALFRELKPELGIDEFIIGPY
ncbi:hypothetical protein [Sediminicola luteus]|nr:hypothetical protein [Sediminicola luteus]